METIDNLLIDLSTAKQIRKDKIQKILSILHDKLEVSFDRIDLAGQCGKCTGCLSSLSDEKGIEFGCIAFSDGGTCYKPCVLMFDGYDWKMIAYYVDGQLKLTDKHPINYKDLRNLLLDLPAKIKMRIDSIVSGNKQLDEIKITKEGETR